MTQTYEKHIRNAWVAGALTTGATAFFSLLSLASRSEIKGYAPVELIGAGVAGWLTWGIYRKSRACAVAMTLCYLLANLLFVKVYGWGLGFVAVPVLLYFFAQGVRGTFMLPMERRPSLGNLFVRCMTWASVAFAGCAIAMMGFVFTRQSAPSICRGSSDKAHASNEPLRIPTPEGYFDAVTSPLPIGKAWLQSIGMPDMNVRVALYLPNDEALLAREDAALEVRSYDVQLLRENVETDLPAGYFAKEKALTKKNLQAIFDATKAERAQLITQQNGGLDSVLSSTVLPAFYETDHAISYPTVWRVRRQEQGSAPLVIDAVAAFTMLEVKGKALFLYVRAPLKDLEWTKAESIRWAESIRSANP